MNPRSRITYHAELWPAACKAQRWNFRDQEKRRAVVLECMRQVRGPAITTSSPRWGPDETTALFTYLRHLADQASLDKSAAWVECKRDYRTFNRARNADWHERETYGAEGSRKLQRNRFAKRKTAAGDPLDSLDKEDVRKRHITMAERHRKAKKKATPAPAPYVPSTTVPPAGSVILMPWTATESVYEPDPEYVTPADQPF